MQAYCIPTDPNCCGSANASQPNDANGYPYHWYYPSLYDNTAANFTVSQYNKWVAAQAANALPTGIDYLGCFTDSSTRVLPLQLYISSSNNNTMCALGCRKAGFQYSGTEYGNECWCGNTIPTANTTASSCSSVCAGVSSQLCGGSWALSVMNDTTYTPATVAAIPSTDISIGCYVDSGARVYPTKLYQNSSNSITFCAAACSAAGYTFSGTEYGAECYCGQVAPIVTDVASACDVPCAGNTQESCGGGWRLSVYQDTSNSTVFTPPTGISALGCYWDNYSPRSLPYHLSTTSTNTIPTCALGCRAAGYKYSGLEAGTECWCGSTAPTSAADPAYCLTPCPGAPHQGCGGGWVLSVYQDSTIKASRRSVAAEIVEAEIIS